MGGLVGSVLSARPLIRLSAFLAFPRAKQERLRLLGEHLPGLGVAQVEAVVIDDRSLLPLPQRPAVLADGVEDALAELAREGRASASSTPSARTAGRCGSGSKLRSS